MDVFDRRSAPKRADTWFVYALVDSRKTEEIRYIGITNDPRGRLRAHISASLGSREKGHKASWIRSTVNGGGDIGIGILADGMSQLVAAQKEIAVIGELRARGCSLTNTTDGGFGGMAGATHDLVARSRIGAASSARVRTKATRAKLSETFRLAGPQNNSSVNLKGVTYDCQREKWSARITINGKRIKLGRFTTPEEAARAYDAAAFAAWGRDCFLNFPNSIAA
ncbi:hypothetical protein GOB40_13870 [Sinorhizobium meliloti]|nr:hypothetical protein [Sinorhizobium meliloti]